MGVVPDLQVIFVSTLNVVCMSIVIRQPVYIHYFTGPKIVSIRLVIYTKSYPRGIQALRHCSC
jgi:hypothetical protein